MMHAAVIWVAWGVALAWVVKLAETAVGLRKLPNLLRPEFDVAPEGQPTVVVIVPARNEAEDVGECLESLLKQDYCRLRVIAVDDRSEDETGAIMDREASAHSERLKVVHVKTLPEGWLGKPHAMALAARMAIEEDAPDYLLFTDGDVFFRVDAVRRALAQAQKSGADHFVLLPTTVAKTWGEGMLLAYLQVMAGWAVRLWKVGDKTSKRDAVGVGAFNLMRTTSYRELGGFEATPMEVLEDLYLGRRVKKVGMRQSVAYAPGLVSLHWAAGVDGILRGMTKNVFAVFRYRVGMLLLGVTGMGLACVAPAGFLFVPGARMPGVVAFAAVIGMYVALQPTNAVSAKYAVLFPVAAVLVMGAMVRSMAVTVARGGVTWRGTFYPLTELRRRAMSRE